MKSMLDMKPGDSTIIKSPVKVNSPRYRDQMAYYTVIEIDEDNYPKSFQFIYLDIDEKDVLALWMKKLSFSKCDYSADSSSLGRFVGYAIDPLFSHGDYGKFTIRKVIDSDSKEGFSEFQIRFDDNMNLINVYDIEFYDLSQETVLEIWTNMPIEDKISFRCRQYNLERDDQHFKNGVQYSKQYTIVKERT